MPVYLYPSLQHAHQTKYMIHKYDEWIFSSVSIKVLIIFYYNISGKKETMFKGNNKKKAAFQIPSSVNFLYFFHDLSLSVEIWQVIRSTDHKHLLHKFFAVIDDKISGHYTITCYYGLLCLNIESVEHTHHNRIVTEAVVTSTPPTRNLWPKPAETSANCWSRSRNQAEGVPAPNSRHQQSLCFLPFAPIYVSKGQRKKILRWELSIPKLEMECT